MRIFCHIIQRRTNQGLAFDGYTFQILTSAEERFIGSGKTKLNAMIDARKILRLMRLKQR